MKTLIVKEDAVKAVEKLIDELAASGRSDYAKGAYRALRVLTGQKAVFTVSELEMLLNKDKRLKEAPDMASIRLSFKLSGLTFEQLTKMTGIPKSSLQRYISGAVRKIPVGAVIAMENALRESGYYVERCPEDFRKP